MEKKKYTLGLICSDQVHLKIIDKIVLCLYGTKFFRLGRTKHHQVYSKRVALRSTVSDIRFELIT